MIAEAELASAALADKPLLRRLIELYRYDTSEFDGSDVDAQGEYGYRYLDHYWTDSTRHPFLIRAHGQPAGFALVNTHSVLGRAGVRSIAEIFVMRKYRRQGIGMSAARQLLALFPGRWEIFQEEANLGAWVFWNRVIEQAAVIGIKRAQVQTEDGETLHVQAFSI